LGASLETTILVYAAFNLVAALITFPAGTLSDRLGRKTVLMGSFVIFFVAYAGFALSQQVVWVAAMFVFYGLYQGIFRSVGKAFASDFVPDQLRASAVGWYSATMGLLQLLASVVAGLLWDRVGHAAVFAYGAAFALVGIIALSLFRPSQASRQSRKT
jgi:MFS family permease